MEYVCDYTFPLRLYNFIKNTSVSDLIDMEEKDYLLWCARSFVEQLVNSKKVTHYIKSNSKEIEEILKSK